MSYFDFSKGANSVLRPIVQFLGRSFNLSESSEQVVNAFDKQFFLEPADAKRLARLAGPYDENLKQIERRMGVSIRNRGNEFILSGDLNSVESVAALLIQLYRETENGGVIEPEFVHMSLQESGMQELVEKQETSSNKLVSEPKSEENQESAGIKTYKRTIKPRGKNQKKYVSRILEYDIGFGIGPAGTGKTYLAVACVVNALMSNEVARILLVRPAVEAGEKLGFLPGDLAQKIDPYLRPLYDALYEMMGVERVNKLIERNVIEVAPLAYMRGRTLNDSFIILDESQNTTIAQMKMFLTRIGFGSTAIITGDVTQIDLPRGERSGLVHVKQVLLGVEGISFTEFSSRDVVRHPLVQSIVDAYAKSERIKSERAGVNGD